MLYGAHISGKEQDCRATVRRSLDYQTGIKGRVGEVRAEVVANRIYGVWENVRQVEAEPSCLSVLWAVARILMQLE